MMITEQHIQKLVEDGIHGTDIFIVKLTVSTSNAINIVIDSDAGIRIEDCKKVSRSVEGELDREEEDFSLEVISAGVGQPFVMPRQFTKYVNRPVEIMMKDGKEIEGILLKYNEEELELEPRINPGKGRKIKVLEPVTLALADIKETKSAVTFK